MDGRMNARRQGVNLRADFLELRVSPSGTAKREEHRD